MEATIFIEQYNSGQGFQQRSINTSNEGEKSMGQTRKQLRPTF